LKETIMTVLLVIRRGEVKLTLPNPTVKADGSIWAMGNPVLDSEAAGAPDRATLAKLTKAKSYNKIPASCFAKRGENPSGLLILTQEEWDARPERKAAIDAQRAAADAHWSDVAARAVENA
jgi:hypothetical protein